MSERREIATMRKQFLLQLCKNLSGKVANLREWKTERVIDEELLKQAENLALQTLSLDIGFEIRLNELQCCLGKIRVYLVEDSAHYLLVEDCIGQIQHFLDWDQ